MKTLQKMTAWLIGALLVISCLPITPLAAVAAVPTASSVFVDGKLTGFQAYTINGYNYFKLRDIAFVLSGTAKPFEVEYDAAANTIKLLSGKAYTPVGGELATPGGNAVISAEHTACSVYLDGAAVTLEAYTIKGNNYFKLRDIGAAIDFGVIWDGPSNAIKINTIVGYEDILPDAIKVMIADHTCIKLDQIPVQWIEKARADLHIAYGHTSHGSQITHGLLGLSAFKGRPYLYTKKNSAGSLDLRDNPFSTDYMDLGQPDNKAWADATRAYLKKNKDINVVMWSWCGQLSWGDDAYVNDYLSLMQALETEFPGVTFVYMTGHLDGTGESSLLAKNNQKIRDFCKANNKALFDFADIESYNPDGVYFGDRYANDACEYDSDSDQNPDRNWATEWQNAHKKGVDWYECTAEHSQPVNANMKAYAAWWLMARLAGWDGAA